MATPCSHRQVICPNNCGRSTKLCDQADHLNNHCDDRMIICPRGCTRIDEHGRKFPNSIKAKLLEIHFKFECDHRPRICKMCGIKVPVLEIEDHCQYHCTHRLVDCRNHGCLKRLPLAKRDDHEKLRCRFRFVLCRQGCGQKVLAIDVGNHMNKSCEMRQCECPLKCGNSMRYMFLADHLAYECIRRPAK